MLNVEEDLRQKKMPQPGVGLFTTNDLEVDDIPYVSMGLTDILRIQNKAERAKFEFLQNTEMSGAEYFADIEYNNQLKYWAVVYSVSVDDEAAYKVNGLEQVENYVENGLGVKAFGTYDALANEILKSSGVELIDLTVEDEEVTEIDAD